MDFNKEPIGKFRWPFYSYDFLMPKQVQKDLFEWLYLSLIVCKNKELGNSEDSYSTEVKSEVRKAIKSKFSSLIDESTLDNIINSAEEEFVLKDITNSKDTHKVLRGDVSSFLETYEDLFSSQVSIQRVYQDAINGDVVPCFKDMEYIQDSEDNNCLRLNAISKRRPNKDRIQKAYKLFNRLNVIGSNKEEIINEPEEQFIDEDAEVDYIPEEVTFEIEKKQISNDFNAVYLDNTKRLYFLDIEVYTDGQKLIISTPFDREITKQWINKRLIQARSASAELDIYLKELETKYCKNVSKEEVLIDYVYPKDIAEQLKYCEKTYRLIENLPSEYNDLKNLLIKVDQYFTSKDDAYFNCLGKYLECLIHYFVDYSDNDIRKETNYDTYCKILESLCDRIDVNSKPFMSKNIFDNWQKGWENFKSDLADLFINNVKLNTNKCLYHNFVSDAFKLYDLRNNGSHYKESADRLNFSREQMEKLFNVTRVLIELI